MDARYGYIGLGNMGSAMVGHLLSTSASVTVFDLDSDAVDRAVEEGASAASSSAEVARKSDVISVCVPADDHVDEVIDGPDGIKDGATPALTVLVHSTIHPDTVVSAASRAAGWGVAVHDVSVAGGSAAAESGSQTMMVGGLASLDERARALVDIYAGTVIDGGPVGGGAAMKIAFNIMTYSQFAAAAAAHDLLEASGGDTSALIEAWRAAGQLGTLTEQYSALFDLPDEFIGGELLDGLRLQLATAQKDLSLARRLGEKRTGIDAVLAAVHDAMPAIYRAEA